MPEMQENRKLFDQIYNDVKEDRRALNTRKLPEMWERYEAHYRNEYKMGRDKHLSEVTSNALFEVIEAQLPVITARAPKPDVELIPIDLSEDDLTFAKDYSDKVQRELIKIWSDGEVDMQQIVQSGYREHGIKGKSLYNSEFDFVDNKIVNEVTDINSIVPSRFADSIEDCQKSHLANITYRTPEWVKEKLGIDVEPEGYFDDEGMFTFHSNPGIMESAASFAKNVFKTQPEEEGQKRGYCLVIKYYCSGKVIYDEEITEKYTDNMYDEKGVKVKNEAGEDMTEEKERKKWPNGRIITIVRNDEHKRILDKQNIYKRFPYFETTNFKRAGDFWGTSEGLNIETHTMAISMLLSNLIDNVRFTGNPVKIVAEGTTSEDGPTQPGSEIKEQTPNSTRWLTPPQIQAIMLQLPEFLQADIDRKTGNVDAMRGLAQAGDSGEKVKTQIAQGVGRLQPKTNEFLTLARKLYNHWIYIIQNFYPDVIVQEVKDDQGKSVFEEFRPQEGAHLKLQVKIGNTAMLPADNFGEFEEAKLLFTMGLEVYGFPLISPDHLIELAPSLADQQRAKKWVRDQLSQAQQIESQGDTGPQATEEEKIALQNAQEAGDNEAVKAILTGIQSRVQAEGAPLPPEAAQA